MIKANLYQNWKFPCFVILIALCIEISGGMGRASLSYQNNFVRSHEYWRLITGHITHLGWPHFFLNTAGLILVWFLYGKTYSTRNWVLVFLWCSACISLGFYVFDTGLQSYVGLSGVLHGLIAAGLLGSFFKALRHPNKAIPWEDILIFMGLWSKVIYEQIIGPVPLTEAASGAHVVVNAHLYGAISGSIYACITVIWLKKLARGI